MSCSVLTGIDVLQAEGFAPLAGRRVGLITHRSGVNRLGEPTFDIIHGAPNMDLVTVLTPEHGYGAQLDDKVPSSVDSETGIPFHSLYGDTRRPTPEMLDNLDTLVFDLQDVGARFYTYITTMAYAMEEAAIKGLTFVVLDRPNVINGVQVEGPVLCAEAKSFVGYYEVPVRHGMTVGELARWHRTKAALDLDLVVIAMQGWSRDLWFDETALPWLPPSPAMLSLTTAALYPGVCCMERMNLSVGRGTDHPFEWVGAPWIDEDALAQDLESRKIPGVAIQPIEFCPTRSQYADQVCHGVAVEVMDRNTLNVVALGVHLIDGIHRQNPVEFRFGDTLGLIGDPATLRSLKSYLPVEEIRQSWQPSIRAFEEEREPFLLY